MSSLQGIHLICRHSGLLLEYGGLLFGREIPISLGALINLSEPYDERTLHFIMVSLSAATKTSGIVLWAHNSEFNEAVVLERSTGRFIVCNLARLLGQFKAMGLGIQQMDRASLISYLSDPKWPRYAREDLREMERYEHGEYMYGT